MDHQGRSAVGEQGVIAIAQIYQRSLECVLRRAVTLDREVRHVTRMRPLWVLQPMVLLVRIEMWAGRRERWPLTLGRLVNVRGMLAGRQVLEVERNRNAGTALVLAYRGGANALSHRIPQFHRDRSAGGAHDGSSDESDNRTNQTLFRHVVLLPGNPLTN